MELYLVRHGPAEERDPRRWPDDDERPLTRQGVTDTKAAAKGLGSLGIEPTRVLTSPATRALRTAEIVREALGVAAPLATWPELAPDSPASAVLARLSGAVARSRGVVVVGHEPTLGELVGLALTGEATSVVRLSRGGAAAVDFPRSIAPSAGQLDWLLTRRQLQRLKP